jgi:hypothetical protein
MWRKTTVPHNLFRTLHIQYKLRPVLKARGASMRATCAVGTAKSLYSICITHFTFDDIFGDAGERKERSPT